MTLTTDVLIVGGGLMGCSIAYQLASRKISTVLVERNIEPGLETTARSGAIIRAHYGVPELVTLAREANERYIRFEDEVGKSCGFTQCGYMVLVDDDDVPALRANTRMHKDLGVEVSLLRPCDVAEVVSTVKTDDVALASYEPRAGYASPSKTVAAYATRAKELGARFVYNSIILSAVQSEAGWDVKLTGGQEVSCDQVVICAGNWSGAVGSLFSVEIPVAPVRAQIVVMDRPDKGKPMPVVSDLINLAYYREEGAAGMWIGSSDMTDLQEKLPCADGFHEAADLPAIEKAFSKAKLRFNKMPGEFPANVQRSFCGLYETTPDWQPIVDHLPNNIHIATGFSGHGFKLAPVIGDIVAAAAAGAAPRPETALFRLSRFAENKPIQSTNAYQRARFLR